MIRLGLVDYEEKRSLTLADFPQLLINPPVAAGVTVTEATALNFSAYFNGVDIITGQVGTIPRRVYKRLPDDGREPASDQLPLSRLMQSPNSDMTDVVFWQTLLGHVLTWGNGYAEIEWDRAMRPIALWPITPNKIEPVISGGRLAYRYDGNRIIPGEDIIHVAGLGFDGRRGYSVVTMARQSLGLAIAAERYGSSFFGNGAWPGFILEHPGKLSSAAADRIMKSWDDTRRGPDRSHGTFVAEEGMKANKLGIPPDDAQFLQTREFQVVEIARWLNLPPHKLKHKVGERPGGNIEASQIEFLTDTLRPWLVRIEQEVNRKLIPQAQRGSFYVEHLVDAILRVDNVSRMQSYKALFEMGVIDAEQIAKKENLPKPALKPPTPAAPPPVPEALPSSGTRVRVESAHRSLLIDAAARFARREAEKVRKASKRPAGEFGPWVERFCRDERDVLRGHLAAPIRVSLAHRDIEADAERVAGGLADAYLERTKEALLGLPARDLEAGAERMVAEWLTTRPAELAERILAIEPEALRAASPAPVVNVTVNVPEQPTPVVNVRNMVPVPSVQVAAPEVRVDVAAPSVTVNPRIDIPATTVNVAAPVVKNVVQLPPPGAMKIERDAGGNISGIAPKG